MSPTCFKPCHSMPSCNLAPKVKVLSFQMLIWRPWKNSRQRFLFSWGAIPRTGNIHRSVSKNSGTPKWMVYNWKPDKNGWFGGTTIFGNIHIYFPLKKDIRSSGSIPPKSTGISDRLTDTLGSNFHSMGQACFSNAWYDISPNFRKK